MKISKEIEKAKKLRIFKNSSEFLCILFIFIPLYFMKTLIQFLNIIHPICYVQYIAKLKAKGIVLPKTALPSDISHKVSGPLATLTFEQLASNSVVPTPLSDLLEQFTEFRKELYLTILALLQLKDTNQEQERFHRARSKRVPKMKPFSFSSLLPLVFLPSFFLYF